MNGDKAINESRDINVVVLMSTYNGDAYIREQIQSILSQRGCQVDLIVRDDGSKDNTVKLLDEYEQKGLLKQYRDQGNLGPARSFLKLLAVSPDADFFAFADQDDVWNEDKLLRAARAIGQTEIPSVYYSNLALVDEQLKPFNKNALPGKQYLGLEKILVGNTAAGCSMAMNRAMRNLFVSAYTEEMTVPMHDWFLCALCKACGGRLLYDPIPSMLYRQHGNNTVGYDLSGKLGRMQHLYQELFVKKEDKTTALAEALLLYEKNMTKEGAAAVKRVHQYKQNTGFRIRLAGKMLTAFISGKGTKRELLCAVRILNRAI